MAVQRPELGGPSGRNVEQAGDDAAAFQVLVSSEKDVAIVAIRGELDLATAPLVRHRLFDLVARGTRHIDVELGGVTFIDSSGVAALVAGARRMSDVSSGRIALKSTTPCTRRVLEILGVAGVFDEN